MTDSRGNPPLPPPWYTLHPEGGATGSPAPGNFGGGGTPGPSAAPAPLLTIYPWWLYQWRAAVSWSIPTLGTALNFTAVMNAVTSVPSATGQFIYTVPQGNRAVVKTVWATVQNPTATILLSFTLLRNGAPVQGWINVAFPPLNATGFVLPFNGVDIQLDEGETLTAQFTETSGVSWTCSLQATGWQIGKREIERVQSGYSY